jgi:hypothetical protein
MSMNNPLVDERGRGEGPLSLGRISPSAKSVTERLASVYKKVVIGVRKFLVNERS